MRRTDYRKDKGIAKMKKSEHLLIIAQLTFLAILIIGMWLNLQNQLDLLQKDVKSLVDSQQSLLEKLK